MRQLLIWFASSALGAVLIVVLPESLFGEGRLFSLSEGHGPSASDAVGIAIILAGWAWFVRATWVAWRGCARQGAGIALVLLAAAGLAGCLTAVSADRNLAAGLFGLLAVGAQIALAIIPHCFASRESE